MNNRTAHIQFKVILDKNAQGVAFGGAPAFLPEEIDIFLNQGQDEIISNKISGNNPLKVGFEGSTQRMSELDALLRTDVNVVSSNTSFNEFILNNVHNNGERHTIQNISLKLGAQQTNCLLVDHNTASLFKQTYNNIPCVEYPECTIENNNLLIYVDPIMMQDSNYQPINGRYNVDITFSKEKKQVKLKEKN